MKFSQKSSAVLVFSIFLSLFFASSCALIRSVPPEEALRHRVQAYWDARVEGSIEKAYELLEPEARETISLVSYAKKAGQAEILSYNIEDLELNLPSNSATVRVKRDFRIKPGAIPIKMDKVLEQTGTERWVLVEDRWYMSYAVPNLDFLKKNVEKND